MGNIIQYETTAANLLLSLLEQIRRQNFCLTNEFPSPAGTLFISQLQWYLGWVRQDPTPDNAVIHIREPFNSDPLVRYLRRRRVQLIQPVRVSLSSVEQLRVAGGGLPAATIEIDLHLVFMLTAYAAEDKDCFLSIWLSDIEGLPSALSNLQDLKLIIRNLFPARQIPLDVGQLSTLGGKLPIANIDIAVSVPSNQTTSRDADELTNATTISSSTIAVRIEVAPYPTSTSAWEAFFSDTENQLNIRKTGRLQRSSNARRWALFTPEAFLTTRATRDVEESFANSGKFKLQGGISASWSASENRALINLDFFGKAIDACDMGIFGSSDIDVRVNIPIELSVLPEATTSVYRPGSIQRQVKINYWKNDWDTALCVLGTTALWPYLGLKLLEDNKLSWTEYELSLALGPLVAIPILMEANKGGKLPTPKADCVRPDSKQDAFVCTQPFNGGSMTVGGRPFIEDYLGLSEGLVLYGGTFWNRSLSRRERLISIEGSSRGWVVNSVPFSCASIGPAKLANISNHPENFAAYTTHVAVNFALPAWRAENDWKEISESPTVQTRGDVCLVRVRIQDDPLNVFVPYAKDLQISIPITSVPDAYFANPYPCNLLIYTSDGARMITLPPLEKVSYETLRAITLNAWAKAVSICYAKSHQFKDPRWIIDPPDLMRERHFWAVVISGLQAGEQVSLENTAEQVMATAHADLQGRAFMQTLLPSFYSGQLLLRRSALDVHPVLESFNQSLSNEFNPEEFVVPEDYVAIDAKHIQLLQQSEIVLDEPPQMLVPLGLTNCSGLLIVQRSGIAVYDLAMLKQPHLITRIELSELSGVLPTGREMLAWGQHGIYAITIDRDNSAVDLLLEKPVLAVANQKDRCFVLYDGRLEVWNPERVIEQVFEIEGAQRLATTESYLLVGNDHGIQIFFMATGMPLEVVGEYFFEGLTGIIYSNWIGRGEQVILQGDHAELIDLSNPYQVVVVEKYDDVPEMYSLVVYRDCLIAQDSTDPVVKLYSISASTWL